VAVTGANAVGGDSPVAASLIEIGANTASGSILLLDDGSSITNGNLTIAGNSTLDVESALGATLDGVKVTNSGTIQVDTSGDETVTVPLVLDGGTTVTGGKLTTYRKMAEDTVDRAVAVLGR